MEHPNLEEVANSDNSEARSVAPERNSFQPPAVILRQLSQVAKATADNPEDLFDLFYEIAANAGATTTIEYLHVLDATLVTLELLKLSKMKSAVVERMRQKRQREEALEECMVLSAQRSAARLQSIGYGKLTEGVEDEGEREKLEKAFVAIYGEPHPPVGAPPYTGSYSRGDINKHLKPLNGVADDAQAFVDAASALEQIDAMMELAYLRREQAFDRIEKRRRQFGQRIRRASDQIIEGSVNRRVDE